MTSKRWIICGAIIGAIGVAIGAFGAHLLPTFLEKAGYTADETPAALVTFHTATTYHLFHAPMIVLVGLLLSQGRQRALQLAGWAFLLGILLFSGILYVWILTHQEPPWLVHFVPLGGTLLIVGWLAVAAAFCCCGDQESV